MIKFFIANDVKLKKSIAIVDLLLNSKNNFNAYLTIF